ncbi:MAG: hypothetical protein H8E31_00755 [Planctomycetes bacterium]|nr:hypothetical protein [Planctomycetota bacterium]
MTNALKTLAHWLSACALCSGGLALLLLLLGLIDWATGGVDGFGDMVEPYLALAVLVSAASWILATSVRWASR